MRKGSRKSTITPEPNPPPKPPTTPLILGKAEVIKHAIPSYQFVERIDVRILDILTNLCDACHDMDTKTEPWASIRKDIERLR